MPVVSRLRCTAREESAGARADGGQHNGNHKNRSKTAKRSIDEPESDGGQQDRTAGLDSAIISRGFAASLRRGAKGQQRIASGAESCPTESSQGVSEHRCFCRRNKAETHRSRQQKQPADEDTRFRPFVSPATDERPEHYAGHGEASDHQTYFERCAPQRGDEKGKCRLQQRMLRRAEKLRATE